MADIDTISFAFTGSASGALGAIGAVNAGLAELDWAAVWQPQRGMMEMVRAGRQCQKAMTKQRAVKRWNRKRRRR